MRGKHNAGFTEKQGIEKKTHNASFINEATIRIEYKKTRHENRGKHLT